MIKPDLTTLRIFLAVYNLGNISKAAEREHIAPSAISKRIQSLETEIGAILFYRHVRGVTATPAGEALARHAQDLFDSVNRITADLSAFGSGNQGQVRVDAISSALIQFLPHQLADFVRDHPMVRVVLREETSSDVIQSTLDGLTDIGILDGTMEIPPGLRVLPYKHDRLVALVPASHHLASQKSIDFAVVRDSEYISLGTGSSLQILLAREAERGGFKLNTRIAVRTFESAKRMVAAGLGIAVMPEGVVDPQTDRTRIRCVPLADDWANRSLVICIKDKRKLTASAALMLRHLREADGH